MKMHEGVTKEYLADLRTRETGELMAEQIENEGSITAFRYLQNNGLTKATLEEILALTMECQAAINAVIIERLNEDWKACQEPAGEGDQS